MLGKTAIPMRTDKNGDYLACEKTCVNAVESE